MKAAVDAVMQQQPNKLVVAVPVAAGSTADEFRRMLDDFVCVYEPVSLGGVGMWYDDFRQTTDEEVRQLLQAAPHRYAGTAHGA